MLIVNKDLLYYIRKKELERMINKLGRTGSIRRWTQDAINCYKIGCVCRNCPIPQLMKSQKCQMKSSVIELVRRYGAPEIKKAFLIEG